MGEKFFDLETGGNEKRLESFESWKN